MVQRNPRRARALVIVTTAVTLAAATGCARRTALVLHQSFAPASQRELRLTTDWAFWEQKDDRVNCLLAFPLPGAEDGPRDFWVYFTGPDVAGHVPVGTEGHDGPRGFLVQAVGQLAGKIGFTRGTVRWRKPWLSPTVRRVDLDIRCADGTRIVGTAWVRRDADEIRAFGQRFEGDIVALRPEPGQPTLASDQQTAPRSTAAP